METWTVIFVLAIGLFIGILLQKYYPVGKLIRRYGIISRFLVKRKSESQEINVIPSDFEGKMSLFILAGQSNMSGTGKLTAASSVTDPRVFVFGNDYRWHLAKEPIDSQTKQVDKVSEDKSAGVGPGMAFATELLKYNPELIIGLIPCAKSGTAIEQWQRSLSEDTLYGSCLKRVGAASVMGEITGILFFQGEKDAQKPSQDSDITFFPNQWADKFVTLVKDFRQDLGKPDLPVVFAQIGTTTDPETLPNWETVKAQQATVQLPATRMITTDDLALQDYVHLTTESYLIVGKRFAKAFWKLTQR
ncbi:MAG: sialate O-acetylesterase [Moorea sp. SIOASIH]|uniref:sialate O-acetylesterase n=1 Tax=Moorena sp. SIOASIH TaxID=2607817 RepID=UPI0013BD8C99|nr:sialate O-acetylesterase [Moorena sp. SIOASIH]NEO40828.1 sialate O-acetylesterase [Moorena sp. SIOASIH]